MTVAELCQHALSESGRDVQLEDVMRQISQHEMKELQDLKERLAGAEVREVEGFGANEEQLLFLKNLEDAVDRSHNEMRDELRAAEEAEAGAEDTRGDMQDQVVGMEVAQTRTLQGLEEEVAAGRDRNMLQQDGRNAEAREAKAADSKHTAELKGSFAESSRKLAGATSDRDALRRNEVLQQKAQATELEQLRTLIRVTEGAGECGAAPTADAHMLEVLRESVLQNESLQADMRELRLHMAGVQGQNDLDLLSLQRRVDSARFSLDSGEEAQGASRGRGQRAGAKASSKGRAAAPVKMPSIDEEEDDDSLSVSSCGHSGVVSSDGEGVGDLGDFDDDASPGYGLREEAFRQRESFMRDELQQERQAHALFRDQVAGTRARQASKAERTRKQIEDLDADKRIGSKRLDEQNAEAEVEASRKLEELGVQAEKLDNLQMQMIRSEQAQTRRERAKSSKEKRRQKDIDELHSQLYRAAEMQRVLEMRMEDTQREMHRRYELDMAGYEATLSELSELLRAGKSPEAEGAAASGGGPAVRSDVEVQNQQMIGLLQEERNDLLHMLEKKEAQWKRTLEDMDQQFVQDVSVLKKEHTREVQVLQSRLAQERRELLERKAAVESEAKRARRGSREPTATQGEDVPELPAWLAFLKCPQRDMPRGPAVPANCQAACWQALGALPELTAFFCNVKDLEIAQASRKAYKVWGTAALQGQSFLTLLARRNEATWMKRAVGSHQLIADSARSEVPGFLVRDLGCLALRSRSSAEFEAQVTTVHVPEEPARGREKAIVVILHLVFQGGARTGDVRPQAPRRQSDRAPSVSSEDIAPCDSVSRVAERRH